ncbi:UreF-domain-containing protein [Neurospora hispaniola]|uniref:UreF-domain-containing protein n=1 Tax=Neurospora hispaniola TaxID=588809 RepID=A0AAJ0MVS0_9PEZI|nr:UreF-domain-containing protein [Neurospora hispaniola]
MSQLQHERALSNDAEVIEDEIADLERRLAEAKERQRQAQQQRSVVQESNLGVILVPSPSQTILHSTANHFLLLLSDSALPLGSFAFSSGLESYLAHNKSSSPSHSTSFVTNKLPKTKLPPPSFTSFLPLSLSSYASTTLPYVLAAHRDPAQLALLDDTLDATIVCTVGRRASVAQGRALLSIWERSLSSSLPPSSTSAEAAAAILKPFSALLRSAGAPPSSTTTSSSSSSSSNPSTSGGRSSGWNDPPPVSAHLPPLFGAICALVGLSLEQTAYVYLLSHVKALVSAAVRAGMFGPYQAQKTLASRQVQEMIGALMEKEWERGVEEAGQSVPVMDLWIGRHEVLYSRIFNS